MTEPRKQTLQKEVIFTEQPSHQKLMNLLVTYHLRLQIEIHTWVLIHPVMNCITLMPINLAHLCLLDKNFNPDYSDQIQILNLLHSQRNQPDRNGLVLYLPGPIYKLLSPEAKDALQKYNVEAIQKFKASRNLHETNLIHDVYEHTKDNFPSSIEEEEFHECQEFSTDQDLEPPTDDILDFTTRQEHSEDQLDQVPNLSSISRNSI